MDKLKKGVNDVYCSNQDNLKIVFSADREHYFCMRLLKMVGKLIMGGGSSFINGSDIYLSANYA